MSNNPYDSFGPIDQRTLETCLGRLAEYTLRYASSNFQASEIEQDLEVLGYQLSNFTKEKTHELANKEISLHGILGEAPLTALLLAYIEDQALQDKYQRGLLLIARISIGLEAKRVQENQSFQGAIKRACDAYRLLAKSPENFEKFPKFDQNLEELKTQLEALEENSNNTLKDRASKIGALIRYWVNDRDAITRNAFSRSPEEQRAMMRSIDFGHEENCSASILQPSSEKNPDIPEDGHINDMATGCVYVEQPDFFSDTAPSNIKRYGQLEFRRQLKQLSRKSEHLPCDYQLLTDMEASIIWNEIRKDLNQEQLASDWIGALFCALSLCTGRPLKKIVEIPISEKLLGEEAILIRSKNHCELVFHPKFPKNDVSPETSKFLMADHTRNRSVRIKLPSTLCAALLELSSLAQNDKTNTSTAKFDATSTYMKKLNNILQRPLSINRLSSFLASRLKSQSVDLSIINLLTGKNPDSYPGLYYTSIKTHQISSVYHEFIGRYLDGEADSNQQNIPQSKLTVVGTNVMPSESKLSDAFLYYREKLCRQPTLSNSQILAFHNNYTFYCYLLLSLSTGHRPVTAPFEKITDIDLNAGFIWISDKERRKVLSARLAPLPDIAIQQTHNYTDHLKNFSPKKFGLPFNIISSANDALSGRGPFLFFLEDDQVHPLRPQNLYPRLEKVWPFPLNWHRHFLRSKLPEFISPQLIDTFLGHGNFHNLPLDPRSGLSVHSIKSIAQGVNEVLETLKVEALEGLKK